ncbi:MAG: hypothetical protein H0W66_03620 [Chthoniobacterales bacterium]|nr:hypothetical protein [Chthoniobacterales bacterium]
MGKEIEHGAKDGFERVNVNQNGEEHRPTDEDRDAISSPYRRLQSQWPRQKMLKMKVGTFRNAANSAAMSSGICCAAMTSIVIAKANAASMNVSSRVICMPRNRNPSSRGSASRSGGSADSISSFRELTAAVMP